MSEIIIIDPQAIAGLRSLDTDDSGAFLHEIIGIFLDDTPQRILELHQSMAAGDRNKFTRAAHSIKGSSSNLGALLLRAVAENLELQVNKNGFDGVGPLLTQLETEFGRARNELTKLLPDQPA